MNADLDLGRCELLRGTKQGLMYEPFLKLPATATIWNGERAPVSSIVTSSSGSLDGPDALS